MIVKNCMKRRVISILETGSIREAAKKIVEHHIGTLPVLNQDGLLVGTIRIHDLLLLQMPSFFSLISDLDFIDDYGAVEASSPPMDQLDRPVSELKRPAVAVEEDSGLLAAYGLLLQHQLTDIPVVSEEGKLVGIVSHVDIGATILATWNQIGA